MHIVMTIHGFALDSIAQMPVVLLKDEHGEITLPIWINGTDTLYIVAELIRRDASSSGERKDLLTALLGHLGAEVLDISIDGGKDGKFICSVRLMVGEEELRLPVRISEAIVLALKNALPVMVPRHLVEEATAPAGTMGDHFTEADERRFVDFLEGLDPADLGKYPM